MTAAKFCGVITMSVVLCILSSGPMAAWHHGLDRIDMKEWVAANFAKADRAQTFRERVTPLYEPLSWLGRRSRPFQQTLEWYQCLWSRSGEPLVW